MPTPDPTAAPTATAEEYASPPRAGWRDRLSHFRSLAFFLPAYFLLTAACGTVSLFFSLFDASGRWQHRTARVWANLLLAVAGVRVTTRGREHLIRDRPCVMVCNHLSYMDIPVLYARLPVQFRIVAREDLFRWPFLGWHLRRSGQLPVNRERAEGSLRSLMRAAESVRHGRSLFLFPEGGRSMDGRMRAFLPGAFFLAARAQAPIVPMALKGTRELLPPHSFHLRPRRVVLTILPPLETAGLRANQAGELAAQTRALVAAAIGESPDEAGSRAARPAADEAADAAANEAEC